MTRTAAPNSTFAIGGVSRSADSFVVAESSVLRINFCAEKPAHSKSAKRYAKAKSHFDKAFYGTSNETESD